MLSVMMTQTELWDLRPQPNGSARDIDAYSDAMRNFATALTHLEAAKMFAVNGLFARKNAGVQ